MKKCIFLILVLCVFCGKAQANSTCGDFFAGEHPIRKMINTNASEGHSSLSGYFVLGFGSISGEGNFSSGPAVSFAWKGNQSQFNLTTLPLNKIRIEFDDSLTVPTVKFKWRYCMTFAEINPSIVYAVIRCRETDWPAEIELPMQGRKRVGK